MWEQFMKCFKKGVPAKDCKAVKLVDLYKRVPPNQRKQFKEFAKKNEEYKIRLRKYPSKIPAIDWKFYKQNVRKEMVGWVGEFEKKYDKLDSLFANRHSMIDHSKYFGEVDKQTLAVKKEVEKFKEESQKRIKILECKMEHLKSMQPYAEMTMEEFCYAHPDEAPDFINRPTFWPHTPEEQKPGPSGEDEHGPKDPDASGDKKNKEVDPSKPPPKAPPTGSAPDGDKSKPTANAETEVTKDIKEKKETPPKDEKKPEKVIPPKDEKQNVAKAKVEVRKNTEGQAVDTAAELVSKGVVLAKALTAKAIAVLDGFWVRGADKMKTSQTASTENKPVLLVANTAAERRSEERDSFISREGSSDICNKTIIRGDDTAKADVKPQHVDLVIEGEQDNVDKDCQSKTKSDQDKPKRKTCEEEEPECPPDENKCMNMIGLAELEKKRTSPCEDSKNTKFDDKRPTSKLPEPFSGKVQNMPKARPDTSPKMQQKPHETISNNANPLILADKSKFVNQLNENNTSTNQELERARLTHVKNVGIETPKVVDSGKLLRPVATMETEKKTPNPGKKQSIQCLANAQMVGADTQQPAVSSKGDVPDSDHKKMGVASAEDVAKLVFKMATNAASLLSEAKNSIEVARSQQNDEAIESAYKLADQKVNEAMAQVKKALSSAKLLAKQANANEQAAVALIEKHAMLAKLLAHRAINMKKEITKLLAELKNE